MRLLTLTVLACIISIPAWAQLRVSEEEKAVFAFFQLGERVPNYDEWIFSLEDYKTAPEDLQEDLYHMHDTRLKWGFGTYNHKEDFLKITTKSELFVTEKDSKYMLHFRFPGSEGEEYPYFPYQYREDWIALVVNDLGRFTSIPITQQQYEGLKPFLKDQQTIKTKMRMRVRPLNADFEKPLLIDDNYFWVMTGDIAYLGFETENTQTPQTLYNYTAPWYLTDTEAELLELLQ